MRLPDREQTDPVVVSRFSIDTPPPTRTCSAGRGTRLRRAQVGDTAWPMGTEVCGWCPGRKHRGQARRTTSYPAEQSLAEKPSLAPGLDDTYRLRRGDRGQRIAKFTRTAGEMLQRSCAPLARIGCSRLLLACLVLLSQMIDDPCDLVRRRHDGLLRSQPRPHRANIGPAGRVGPCHRLGCLAKRLGGAVDDFQGLRA